MDGWDDTEEWEVPPTYNPNTKVSIIIAARNEEESITRCLESIMDCEYPDHLYEIIVVNDHSEDNTEKIVLSFDHGNIKLINLENSVGKKHALEVGIGRASGDLIGCTDADCLVPKGWILNFANLYEAKQSKCIAGPISYHSDRSLIQRFQFLDALNNMCVTANGIRKKSYYMANGANLFFDKTVFEEIGGHRRELKFASGDDMFLIQNIANKYPDGISFLKSKNAIVKTEPESTLNALINQRTRWATKSKAYSNNNIIKIQGFVFVFVLMIILNLVLSLFGFELCLFGFLFAIFIKWTIDYLYLSKLSDYFEDREPIKSFFGASIGFVVYILFAGWKALSPTTYEWKGRITD